MANKIKGITIEIGGDATGLNKALSDVNKSIRDTQSELKDVDRLLKIDPKNTELLTQKQKLLTKEIADTRDKLTTLREAEKQAQQQFKEGKISEQQYNALKREVISTENAEKNLTAQLKETNKSLEGQGDSMKKSIISADLMAEAIKKIGAQVVELAKSAVAYNAQMETFTASFSNFLGGTAEAEKAIAAIKEDAASMPFGSSDLIEANRALITAGESADSSRKAINNLAQAVAATGGGNAELTRMATNLAQIKNVGKATSMDIRQFANAGINIYGLLAEATGKNIDEVKNMEVSYDLLCEAFDRATQEGGMFYGAMEAQSNTYNGQLNALKAKIQDSLGKTFESIMTTLRDKVFPAINKALDSIDFEGLGAAIGSIVSAVGTILPAVIPIVSKVINLIGSIIKAISPVVQGISTALAEIIDLVSNIFAGKWSAAWRNIVNAASGLFSGLTNTLINIINSVIGALNKVISWFNGNANTIGKIANYSGSSGGSKSVSVTSSSGSKKILPHVYAASGGKFSNGSVIVGESGPELLTMNGGVATVTPITNNTTNLGSINLSVYGAEGQSVTDLADIVMSRIQTAVDTRGAVWA